MELGCLDLSWVTVGHIKTITKQLRQASITSRHGNATSQVAPRKFSGNSLEVLTSQIEAKFADRVVANVGLCLGLHSYESIGDPYIYPSDGSAHYKVSASLIRWFAFLQYQVKALLLGGRCKSGIRNTIFQNKMCREGWFASTIASN